MIRNNPNPISLSSLIGKEGYSPLSFEEEYRLVVQARNGSRIAKERLFRSASKALVQVARRSATLAKRNGFEVDELVSIGYLAFERAIIDYKAISTTPFSGFLYKCALFKILDAIRKYRTAITLPVCNNLSPDSMLAWRSAASMFSIDEKRERLENFDIPEPVKEVAETTSDRKRIRRIARAVAGIAPRKKEVFRLYFGIDASGKIGDYIDSCNDIASRLGIAGSTVKSNLSSAKKEVRGICNRGPRVDRNVSPKTGDSATVGRLRPQLPHPSLWAQRNPLDKWVVQRLWQGSKH